MLELNSANPQRGSRPKAQKDENISLKQQQTFMDGKPERTFPSVSLHHKFMIKIKNSSRLRDYL